MAVWTGVVLARDEAGGDAMASRIPACLHPIAGRPLLWHVVWSLSEVDPRPSHVVIVADFELSAELFHDLPVDVSVASLPPDGGGLPPHLPASEAVESHTLVIHGAAVVSPTSLTALVHGPAGGWIPEEESAAAAAWVDHDRLGQLSRLPAPLEVPNGALAARDGLADHRAWVVRDRIRLARTARQVRDRLVENLMRGGATFMLPESVMVDVDVRIGRDSVVYPGVVLEGQTTIGEETVIGPSCRIVDSWVGSGVELKGWNYISHTSIRNRAILEPYVRRGFD